MVTNITTWMSLIQPFLVLFTQPGGVIFTQLISGWILCTVRRTVTGILPYADPAGHHARDAFHRFFPDARWQLWRVRIKCMFGSTAVHDKNFEFLIENLAKAV